MKNVLAVIVFVSLTLFSLIAKSQESFRMQYSSIWNISGVAVNAVGCADGGYFIECIGKDSDLWIPTRVILKTDSDGIVEWSKTFADFPNYKDLLVATSDSGLYFILSSNDDLFTIDCGILKLDKYGNIRQSTGSNYVDVESYIEYAEVEPNTDNLLIGGVYSPQVGASHYYFAKLDTALNVQFSTDFQSSQKFQSECSKTISFGGSNVGYVLGGFGKNIDSTYSPAIVKLDSAGQFQWEYFYKTSSETYVVRIVQLDSNFYLLENNPPAIRKIDFYGNTLSYEILDTVFGFGGSISFEQIDSSHLLIAFWGGLIEADLNGIATRAIRSNHNYYSTSIDKNSGSALFTLRLSNNYPLLDIHFEKENLDNTSCDFYPVTLHGRNGIISDSSAINSVSTFYAFGGNHNYPSNSVSVFSSKMCSSLCNANFNSVNPCPNICNGTISATPASGYTPFTFTWITGDTTATVDSLCTGNYSFIMSDSTGCSSEYSITLSSLNIGMSVTQLECYGDCNAVATSYVSNGVPPYTYLWNTNDITDFLDSLCSGTYSVIVEDSNHCIDSVSRNILQPAELLITASFDHNPTCAGCADGYIIVNGTGGNQPYSLSWLPPNGTLSSDTIFDLPSGVYSVMVTDANGCTASFSDTLIDQPDWIRNFNSENYFELHPNPTSSSFTISSSSSPFQNSYLEIFNLLSEKIYSTTLTNKEQTINIESLPSGIYFVSVQTELGRAVQKLVKQ